jgi:hypothetical protein
MSTIVFDTGFLYSLAVTRQFSDVLFQRWGTAGHELWVPGGVVDEIRIRINKPGSLPPELPGRAHGMILSKSNNLEEIRLTDDELIEALALAETIPKPPGQQAAGGDDSRDEGESECAVLIAGRRPDAVLAIDERRCLPVVLRYIQQRTGKTAQQTSSHVTLETIIKDGTIDKATGNKIAKALTDKGRLR